MGPALKKVFNDIKIDLLSGGDYLREHLRSRREHAEFIKRKLFDTHGEALIAALEKLANEADGFSGLAGPVIVGHTNMKVLKDRIAIARQLLAQLESEAQP